MDACKYCGAEFAPCCFEAIDNGLYCKDGDGCCEICGERLMRDRADPSGPICPCCDD